MYRLINKEIKKGMREAKEKWIGDKCKEIEDNLKRNNSKRAYQVVKELTNERKTITNVIKDKSGKSLTEEKAVIKRWTEYCSELYNYEANGDPTVLNFTSIEEEESLPILRTEVEAATRSLKRGKSAGVDNIPGELIRAGGESLIDFLTIICNNIWQTGEWPSAWTTSLVITLPKKGNIQLCQNYRTISLISHASKVMLKVILNRLNPQAENTIAEEQAGFRVGRSTTEQIFNLRVLCEKYQQHQRDIYHIFIDFKKAFDRVWHAALWATMRRYNITADIIRVVQSLYEKATSAVLINGTLGDWFRTTIGVRQGCILSPTLFNIFLEEIMTEALEKHHGTVSIGGRTITNLRFADDIDGLAGDEEELEALAECMEINGMEINADKTKVMTSNSNGIQNDININDHAFDTVSTFKYLGSIISEEGSKPEILARTAQATAAMTKLKRIWKDKNIQQSSKVRLVRALVISIFLYACESWTLTAELERRIGAMEMRCYRKLLGITYLDRVTNDNVRRMIREAIGPYDELLSIGKKRKLRWYGHVMRSTGLSKTILQGTLEGTRRRGGQRRKWEDDITKWTGLGPVETMRLIKYRHRWTQLSATSTVVPQRSSRSRDSE